MSKQINLYEAKTRLSELVDKAAAGQEFVIAKNGKAKARIVPLKAKAPAKKRKLGVSKLRIIEIDRAATDAEITRLFEAGGIWPNT